MPIVKINEKEYDFDLLSAEAKQQLGSLQFVDAELQRLNSRAAVLQTWPSYLSVLPEIIDKSVTLNYSSEHYGNYSFISFCLCFVDFKG